MKHKFVSRFHFWCPKMSFRNEVVWLIYLKRAVKYQCPDFPWHATLNVPRPWFLLTHRDIGVRNMTSYDTLRSLTRRVPIHDSPSVEEYHGPVNSTKLLISRSESHGKTSVHNNNIACCCVSCCHWMIIIIIIIKIIMIIIIIIIIIIIMIGIYIGQISYAWS